MYSPLPIFPAPREALDAPGRFEFSSRLEARVPAGELSALTRELLGEMFFMHCQTACTLSFREDAALPAHTAVFGAPLPETERPGGGRGVSGARDPRRGSPDQRQRARPAVRLLYLHAVRVLYLPARG